MWRSALVVLALAGCGRHRFDDISDGRAPDTGIVELTLRGRTACVRSGDGRLACWGRNENGEVGVGRLSVGEPPQLVGVADVVAIGTGEFATYAIDRSGALWGWGRNATAQLGLGSAGGEYLVPVQIRVPEPVVAVAAGETHACAITAGARELYCWGRNTCGAIGGGDVGNIVVSPRKVDGVSGVMHVTATDLQTCFLDGASNLSCMGASVGDNDVCLGQSLVPAAPPGLARATAVAGGCHHSTCAIDLSGDVWCWGENIGGVIGDGTFTRRVAPTRLATASPMERIGTGFSVSCSASTDDVFCWGDNLYGQLGVGDMGVGQAGSPVQVPFFDGRAIDQVETGCVSVCVRSGREIYCWGSNETSLVDGGTVDAFAPLLRGDLPF